MINELVTVAIPTIEGREEFLEEAVESARNQTLGIPAIKTLLDVNREGPAKTRNKIVNEVNTPWILFLDDDDWLHPDYLEIVLKHFRSSDIVYTWCERINVPIDLDRGFDADALRAANYIPVTACVRTTKFWEVGGFPENAAYEDWGLWLRMLNANSRFTCVPSKHWTYRIHEGSFTPINQHRVAMGESASGY